MPGTVERHARGVNTQLAVAIFARNIAIDQFFLEI